MFRQDRFCRRRSGAPPDYVFQLDGVTQPKKRTQPMTLPTKKVLTFAAAQLIAQAARAEASKNGWNMAICVVDDGGHMIYLERMDGTQVGSVQVAQDKARTAAFFKRPTKVFEEAIAGGRTVLLKLRGAIPVEGEFLFFWPASRLPAS